MKQMLNSALVFAAKQHDGQFDKGGNPYIFHVLTVFHLLRSEDEELNCIALLHDVVEDTDATWEQLKDIGMTIRVINGVKLLTKMQGQTYEEYQNGVLSSVDAIRVKMADLRHNMDVRRLKGVTERDMNRIIRYAKFYSLCKVRLAEMEV